ncbi:MAG: IS1634 family transposase [Mobilitalea sp.]
MYIETRTRWNKNRTKFKELMYLCSSYRDASGEPQKKAAYLGTKEEFYAFLNDSATGKKIGAPVNTEIAKPIYTEHFQLGAVAAMYDAGTRLNFVKMIDKIVEKRNQGLSTGFYLLVAIINRAIAPTSKAHLEDWYGHTFLKDLQPIPAGSLSSQRFWDNTSRVTEDVINQFELQFMKMIVKKYDMHPKCIIYDATNFFTYIDTENTKASLAQRGHSKEKRTDLRIIGLSVMLSDEDDIPLFYNVYSGNRHDAEQFAESVKILKERYRQVFGTNCEATLVFDRGNNSQDNIELLEEPFSDDELFYNIPEPDEDNYSSIDKAESCRLHYVGGIKRNQCPEIFKVPKASFSSSQDPKLIGTTYFTSTCELFGRKMTVVMTHNEKLLEGQIRGIENNLHKCMDNLDALQKSLEYWRSGTRKRGRKPTHESVQKRIDSICSAEFMDSLIKITWLDEVNGIPAFKFSFSKAAYNELCEHYLGKNALFTDRSDWTAEEIILAYRSAWKIEHTFRRMKRHDHFSVRPIWCWTDQKIRVHIFCCVMAIRFCMILRKELGIKGIETTPEHMLDLLSKKFLYVNYYGKEKAGKSRPIKQHSLSKDADCEDEILQMVSALGLGKYFPG